MPAGSGTEGSPYQISSLNNLYWISENSASWNSYFIQTTDIDASETTTLNSGAGWMPIGNGSTQFRGSYDGQRYKIDGLYIDRDGTNYIGLFGYTWGATLTDLVVTNVNMTGNNFVGAIAGHINSSSHITNCSSSGQIYGSDYAGGLIGYFVDTHSLAEYSHSSCSVDGTNYIGGFIGYTYGGTINDCFATGPVTGISRVGGLVADNSTCSINRSYSVGNVNGSTYVGGLVGYNSGTVNNCFWDTESSGQSSSAGNAIGEISENMKLESTYTDQGWDFTTIWTIDEINNNGYPYLINNPPETPTPISLLDFHGTVTRGTIMLSWQTASETNNARFVIYRNGEAIASVLGAGTSTELLEYIHIDNTVIPGQTYTYVLADIDYANKENRYEKNAVTVSMLQDLIEPDLKIYNAYPNPFNPRISLNYKLYASSHLDATVYNTQGVLIETLINAEMSSGTHQLTWDAATQSSGVYILRMQAGKSIYCQKIILVK
jgi:Secretion system C-terminal sorting domain/The GLUG motif